MVSNLSGEFEAASFYSWGRAFTDGELGAETWTLLGELSVKLWTGTAADAIVSDRYKVDLAGVIILDPDELNFTIADENKVVVNSVEYSVIHAEDIGGQGKVMQIPVKRFKQ